MIMDLEDEKVVDSSQRLDVVSGYSQLCTVLGILGLICDLMRSSAPGLIEAGKRG
jgi:hypothetical protein